MTHQIVKRDNYLLLVDELSDVKYENIGDIWNEIKDRIIKKTYEIFAHLPLNNAPTLEGVPLLPPLEVVKYTDEDLFMLSAKVVNDIAKNKGNAHWNFFTTPKMIAEEFIQSLQQYPVAFEYEMEYKDMVGYWYKVDEITKEAVNRFDLETRPKTITNSQGLTQVVGKYIY